MRRALGTAPMNGPKTGIIFVTPIIRLTRELYGIERNERTI